MAGADVHTVRLWAKKFSICEQEDGANGAEHDIPLHDEVERRSGGVTPGVGGAARSVSDGDRADAGDHVLLRKSERGTPQWRSDLPGDGPPISKYETADEEGGSSSDGPRGAPERLF